jgi:SAM-dependent methyltransferase
MDRRWKNRVKEMSVRQQWDTLFSDKKKVQKDHSIWGPGDVHKNSKKLIELLPEVLEKLDIKSFTDVGCGDFMWLNKLDWSEIKYTGLDIVERMMQENQKKYPELTFKYMNLIEEVPPKSDMIFLRSVLIHTSIDGCLKMIENIKKSGSKYLMASTLPYIDENLDTSCLWLVKRNLQIEPFNFKEPLFLIPEMDRNDINNYMGVWKIDEL